MKIIVVALLFSLMTTIKCMEKEKKPHKDVLTKSKLGTYCQKKLTKQHLKEKKPRQAASLLEALMMRQERFDTEKKTVTFSDCKYPEQHYSSSLKDTMKMMRTTLKTMHWYSRLGKQFDTENEPQGTNWFIKRHAREIYTSLALQKDENRPLHLFSRHDVYIFQLRRFYFFLMSSKFQQKSFVHNWVLNNQTTILKDKPAEQNKIDFLQSFIQDFRHDQRLKALLCTSIEEDSLTKLKKALKKKPKLTINISLEEELAELTQEMLSM